jgi:hypothetical protein
MTRAIRKLRNVAYGMAGMAALACAEGTGSPTEVQPAATHRTAGKTDTPDGAGSAPSIPDTTTFVVNANVGGDFKIAGEHWIHIPRGAICNPVTSTYGPSEWDESCPPAAGKITVTAVSLRDSSGRPRIDFTPAMRFVPSAKTNGWVYLTFADRLASRERDARILYCGDDAVCVDETVDDATLMTNRSTKLGTVSRRIKHFSGYLVTAGRRASYE